MVAPKVAPGAEKVACKIDERGNKIKSSFLDKEGLLK